MNGKFYINYLNKTIQLEKNSNYILGRGKECEIYIPDGTVSRNHAEIAWDSTGFIIKDLGSTNGTFVNSIRITEKALSDGDKIRTGNSHLLFKAKKKKIIKQSDSQQDSHGTMIIERQIADIMDSVEDPELVSKLRGLKGVFMKNKMQLAEQAIRDTLTGLYNRRFFDKTLKDEINRAKRYKRDISLIMIDIDHFKQFNDTYGHQKGDDVLRTAASILAENSRNSDIVARYGGEEMVIILPETPVDKASLAGEKVRLNIAFEAKKREGVKITISVGVAGFNTKNDTPEKLIKAADTALYAAKEKGRNRVCTDE